MFFFYYSQFYNQCYYQIENWYSVDTKHFEVNIKQKNKTIMKNLNIFWIEKSDRTIDDYHLMICFLLLILIKIDIISNYKTNSDSFQRWKTQFIECFLENILRKISSIFYFEMNNSDYFDAPKTCVIIFHRSVYCAFLHLYHVNFFFCSTLCSDVRVLLLGLCYL